MLFAGLWEKWKLSDDENFLEIFTILTTLANSMVARLTGQHLCETGEPVSDCVSLPLQISDERALDALFAFSTWPASVFSLLCYFLFMGIQIL